MSVGDTPDHFAVGRVSDSGKVLRRLRTLKVTRYRKILSKLFYRIRLSILMMNRTKNTGVLFLGAILSLSLIATPSLVGVAFSDKVERFNDSGKGARLLFFDGSVFINVFVRENISLESGAGEEPEKDYRAIVFMAKDSVLICQDEILLEPNDFAWNFGKTTLHFVGNTCGEVDITWEGIGPTKVDHFLDSFDLCEELGFIFTFSFNGQIRDAIATGSVHGFTFDSRSVESPPSESFIDNGQGWSMQRQCSP